ncbi:MAG: hypothetical protein ABFD92_20625 [Planctomycetaceae bacterium]|nr:hypothetical protein [Planctomycetaceae bacterium]
MSGSSARASSSGALASAVGACRSSQAFMEALALIYSGGDDAVASRSLSCRACGRCCKFDQAGHRLFVSTGELALLSMAPLPQATWLESRCPYQIDDRCTARRHRPLGCRVYFCNAPEQWDDLYETLHGQIRQLHQSSHVPYAYVEMTAAVRILSDFFKTTLAARADK